MTWEDVTYFARFQPGYIKVGFSWSPVNRHFGAMAMKPSDVDLGTREFFGCMSIDDLPEKHARNLLESWRVDGCREWFHETPEAVEVIKSLPLKPIPARRLTPAQVRRKLITLERIHSGTIRRKDTELLNRWTAILEAQALTGRLVTRPL